MATITIHKLTKRFGSVNAVNDLSLDIADREFLVLLGPSGAGKTTTLRCVAGLETPDAGDLALDGAPTKNITPAERDIAFVFQTYALYPRKTVFENIASPLEARKLSRADIETRVRAVAAKLHIERLLERKPNQLSGGEQQRVALCRAMVRQPRAFLMDEPLTNLDFKLRVEMRAELKHLHADMATTFFYVTNDQLEALSLADRIAVLNKGTLQQVDTPENIYDRPSNRFVASFIGAPTMNFLDCHLSSNGEPQLMGDGWTLAVPSSARDAIHKNGGDKVVLGIRPEDLTLSLQNHQPSDLVGDIYAVEPLGDRNIFDVHIGQRLVRVKAPPTQNADMGARAYLSVNRERIHLFDPRTDKAIL
ncbi:MAG: ABC transporter ATP-binding protein [Chloroflexota bacterium]